MASRFDLREEDILEMSYELERGSGGTEGYPNVTDVVESPRLSGRTAAYITAGLLLLSLIIGGAREGLQKRIGSEFRMPFSGELLHQDIVGEQPQDNEELPMLGNFGQGN